MEKNNILQKDAHLVVYEHLKEEKEKLSDMDFSNAPLNQRSNEEEYKFCKLYLLTQLLQNCDETGIEIGNNLYKLYEFFIIPLVNGYWIPFFEEKEIKDFFSKKETKDLFNRCFREILDVMLKYVK